MTNAHTLIHPESTTLIVIDEQEKLMPVIEGAEGIIINTQRLLRLAKWLRVPALLTTQNRKGLGPIVPGVEELADAEPLDKVSFGCMGTGRLGAGLSSPRHRRCGGISQGRQPRHRTGAYARRRRGHLVDRNGHLRVAGRQQAPRVQANPGFLEVKPEGDTRLVSPETTKGGYEPFYFRWLTICAHAWALLCRLA
jgi:hypothetical protein